jgi:chromosome segregation ATPase
MKPYLSAVLAIVCLVLIIALVVVKHGDDAQHDADAGAVNDFSNQLDSAQTRISEYHGTILILSNSLNVVSNSLDESRSATLTFSNHLAEAESAIARDAEQITGLKQQVAEVQSDNQTLSQRAMDLTNQLAGVTLQLASTQASLSQTNNELVQANKDYGLLENRFRRNVAERLVLERKFRNINALHEQIDFLKYSPEEIITAERIYAGLDVEVNSNGTAHVISPN